MLSLYAVPFCLSFIVTAKTLVTGTDLLQENGVFRIPEPSVPISVPIAVLAPYTVRFAVR